MIEILNLSFRKPTNEFFEILFYPMKDIKKGLRSDNKHNITKSKYIKKIYFTI